MRMFGGFHKYLFEVLTKKSLSIESMGALGYIWLVDFKCRGMSKYVLP